MSNISSYSLSSPHPAFKCVCGRAAGAAQHAFLSVFLSPSVCLTLQLCVCLCALLKFVIALLENPLGPCLALTLSEKEGMERYGWVWQGREEVRVKEEGISVLNVGFRDVKLRWEHDPQILAGVGVCMLTISKVFLYNPVARFFHCLLSAHIFCVTSSVFDNSGRALTG